MYAESPALSASVLVLNRMYMAVRVVSARRAMSFLFRDLAEVVSVEQDQYSPTTSTIGCRSAKRSTNSSRKQHDWIRTIHFQVAVPKIVRLLGYDRLPKSNVKLNRRNIFARDQNRCQYCGKRFATSELSLDHVVPRSQGGGTSWMRTWSVPASTAMCARGGRTAAAGAYAPGSPAAASEALADPLGQAVGAQIRELEAVPRVRVLECRAEVTIGVQRPTLSRQKGVPREADAVRVMSAGLTGLVVGEYSLQLASTPGVRERQR